MNEQLPNGWEWATLEDLCEVTLGQSPPGGSYNTEGNGSPFFQGKAEFGDRFPEVRKWTTEPKKHAPAGSVLLSVRAPVGPTNVAPMDCAIGRGLVALGPLGRMSTGYIFWVMRTTASVLASQATGSTFEAVTGKRVRDHRVPVAPLPEQERIVTAIEEHLSRLDVAGAAVAAVRRKLFAFRRSTVAELFGRPDWNWTTLGEIAETKGGVTKDSKRQNDPGYVEVPYLRVANVQRGFLDLSEITMIRVSPAKAEQLVLHPGDILFNEGGDRDKLGRGWVWDGQIDNCIHQNHVFRARLSNSKFDPRFVSMHGNTWGQQWFETHGKQTTNLASINLTTLRSFPVPAPPLDQQHEVMAELDFLMGSEDRLRTEVDQAEGDARALRRSILAAAFSGRLVDQNPADEPAAVLLDWIAAERPAPKTRRKTSA